MKLKPPQQELVDRVRRDLGPHGIKLTDEDIVNHWQGSLELHRLELAYAWLELKREIKKAIPQKIRGLLGLQS